MVRTYKVICPLIKFQILNELTEGVDLLDGVKVRRISKEDLNDLKDSIFPLSPETIVSPTYNMFVLEKYITTKDGHKFQLDQTMRNIVLAMRLLKKGYVSANCIFYILVSEKLEKFVSVDYSCEGVRRLEPWVSNYVLHIDEIPVLKNKIEKIKGVDFAKRRRLLLACKRFQRVYEEDDFEDKIIDSMIAFEALFVRKEGSKTKQIANGCSDLLGKNDEEKEEIRRFLTKAYRIRGRIVHGGEIKIKDGYYMFKVVSKTEDYLRASLNKKIIEALEKW